MRISFRAIAACAAASLLALPAAARAQSDSVSRRVALHGYVTQAAGVSRGGDAYGIPAAGTVDYRRIALLGRAAVTPSDRLVLQLANRRRGTSEANADLRVDWAFYERTFGDATRLRVGRSPTPFGIHNETRYVGALLPFFHAPASVYREGAITNESIDGAVLLHELFATSATPLEVAAYAGGVERFGNGRGRAGGISHLVGTQLWWSTPLGS